MRFVVVAALLSLASSSTGMGDGAIRVGSVHTRVAFGSCNRQDKYNAFWPVLDQRSPDAFVWLGDIVYTDRLVAPLYRVPATPPEIEAAYAVQKRNPAYSAFAARRPVFGVYDDHDFGENDGHGGFAHKSAALSLLLDFLGTPANSRRRSQPAAWDVQRLQSADGRHTLRIILLDNRAQKDPYSDKWGFFRTDFTHGPQDMLGAAQWAWLAAELRHKADFTLIGAGIQIIPDDKLVAEGFHKFPASQAKLLAMLAASGTENVLLLSGDVHLAEISEVVCGGATFTEVTSSGLTHSWNTFLKHLAVVLTVPSYRALSRFLDKNAGEIDVHWGNATHPYHVVDMRVLDTHGDVRIAHQRRFPMFKEPTHTAVSADVAACASHDFTLPGVPASCARLLRSCTPDIALPQMLHVVVGTFVVCCLLAGLVASVVAPPIWIATRLCCGRRGTGPLWLAGGSAVYAMWLALLQQQMSITG